MRLQAVCKAFALEFNGIVNPEQSIDFVVTACLQEKGKSGCISLEPYLERTFERYNNNTFMISEDMANPIDRTAQAYSHFTFERSWGQLMVVDLQGVGNVLTDPAIHTKDTTRFVLNGLNFNEGGFKFFFAKHECNEVCQKMGLVSNREMAISGQWQFRKQWPVLEPTTCCANKFCQSIIRVANARTSTKFPGKRWCGRCFPQLEATSVEFLCVGPGEDHYFDLSRYFYTSQGRSPVQKCPDHLEKDSTISSSSSVGAGLWSRVKSTSRRSLVLGNEY